MELVLSVQASNDSDDASCGVLGSGRRLVFLLGLSLGDVSQEILVDYLYFFVSTCLFVSKIVCSASMFFKCLQ